MNRLWRKKGKQFRSAAEPAVNDIVTRIADLYKAEAESRAQAAAAEVTGNLAAAEGYSGVARLTRRMLLTIEHELLARLEQSDATRGYRRHIVQRVEEIRQQYRTSP